MTTRADLLAEIDAAALNQELGSTTATGRVRTAETVLAFVNAAPGGSTSFRQLNRGRIVRAAAHLLLALEAHDQETEAAGHESARRMLEEEGT